jgi:hypothetical protein
MRLEFARSADSRAGGPLETLSLLAAFDIVTILSNSYPASASFALAMAPSGDRSDTRIHSAATPGPPNARSAAKLPIRRRTLGPLARQHHVDRLTARIPKAASSWASASLNGGGEILPSLGRSGVAHASAVATNTLPRVQTPARPARLAALCQRLNASGLFASGGKWPGRWSYVPGAAPWPAQKSSSVQNASNASSRVGRWAVRPDGGTARSRRGLGIVVVSRCDQQTAPMRRRESANGATAFAYPPPRVAVTRAAPAPPGSRLRRLSTECFPSSSCAPVACEGGRGRA